MVLGEFLLGWSSDELSRRGLCENAKICMLLYTQVCFNAYRCLKIDRLKISWMQLSEFQTLYFNLRSWVLKTWFSISKTSKFIVLLDFIIWLGATSYEMLEILSPGYFSPVRVLLMVPESWKSVKFVQFLQDPWVLLSFRMNNFPVGEFCLFPKMDDHLLTLGVVLGIPMLDKCRIAQNSLYSQLWVHMYS